MQTCTLPPVLQQQVCNFFEVTGDKLEDTIIIKVFAMQDSWPVRLLDKHNL